MNRHSPLRLFAALVLLSGSTAAPAQTLLFSDQMNVGTGWEFSHFGGIGVPEASDTSDAEFGFNYSALGIPEAPNSNISDAPTRGLRLATNVPGGWGGDQIAAIYEDPSFTGQYTLVVDVWLNWAAIASGSGTTEHAGVLAGSKVDGAQLSFAPGQNGAGVLFSSDGDAACGTSGSACDYILVKDGAELDTASGQYADPTATATNRAGYNESFTSGGLDLPTLFPSFDIGSETGGLNATGTQPAGTLGFQWVGVTLHVDAHATGAGSGTGLGTVQVMLESYRSGNSFVLGTIDNSIEQDPNDGINTGEQAANLEGGIGLMITDVFGSAASDPTLAFALFDNVRVYHGLVSPSTVQAVPEPDSLGLILLVICVLSFATWLTRGRRRRRAATLSLLILGTSCLATRPAHAVLNLFSDKDHYSLASWSGDVNNIALVGRENHPTTNGWRWMYFEATGLSGAQTQFSIDQAFAGGNSALNNHEMVYSYDNENWLFFDNNQRSGNLYTFSNNSAFTSDTVYVAYAQPYSYGRSAAHTAAVLATPWAEPTVSGDANGKIGETPLAFDDVGRLVPKKDIFAYRITNPATDSAAPKRKVMLTTGMHSGEVLGTHTFEGLINWLVSDDARAARLRDDAEFFAYPTLNAAGRFAGTSRATVENPTQDPNGRWHPTQWVGLEDIQANGEAMMADVVSTPGGLDAFIDFHSTIPSSIGDDFAFIEIDQGDHLADWWLEFRSLQPNVLQTDSTGTSWTSANFADLVLGAEVDITFETEFGNSRPLSYYHDLGKNFGIAFYNAWIQIANPADGDFDEDGDVDAADLGTWQSNYGLVAGAEHYQGDATSDGAVLGSDFLTWQRDFTSTAAVVSSQAVPEPASILSAVLMLAFVTCWRPRAAKLRKHMAPG